MPRAYLTRRVTFAAAHRYRRPDWSDEQNEKAFGPCARLSYHGHSYWCDLTIAGEMDPVTGFIFDLSELDAILTDEVRARFDHRNINTDVPEFADGKLIPSGENLAAFIYGKVRARLPRALDIVDVTVAEDATLSSSFRGDK
jgi:6-pyruvoyltetrahydropterin/6-carboxytetrahydropterin synthase